jgi:glucose/arabinose dehydrogenase
MRLITTLCGMALLMLATQAAAAQSPITGKRPFAAKPFRAIAIATFDHPWAMAFLPDGRMLVTEKKGHMLLLSGDAKRRVEVEGMPAVNPSGQGALGEVVPHPDFARNGLVYFSYSSAGSPNQMVLARGRLVGDFAGARFENVETLYRVHPATTGGQYAGRIAISPDGNLFFSTGERQRFTPAQDHKGTMGKILRLTMDGKSVSGNPLAAKGFDPAIWSYGHRNPLGLAFDTEGRLWEDEMGPRGGDEVNLILPGRNYGWPLVSNGDNYDGTPIPRHATRPDLEAPKLSWNPSISPSSLLIYSGKLFPSWNGKALIGALSGEMLILVYLGADSAREEARYDMGKRIRSVDEGPDGAVYLLEDGADARLLRLTPDR